MNNALHDLLHESNFCEGEHWQRQQYDSQQYIVTEGELNRHVYLVLKGRVQVMGTITTSTGQQLRPGFTNLGAGEVFGELALFDEQPRSASVMALEPCEIAVIHGEQLLAYLDDHPDHGYQVLKQITQTLVQRLRKTNDKVFSLYAWGLKAHAIENHL